MGYSVLPGDIIAAVFGDRIVEQLRGFGVQLLVIGKFLDVRNPMMRLQRNYLLLTFHTFLGYKQNLMNRDVQLTTQVSICCSCCPCVSTGAGRLEI
jgi:hypothetical protein